MDKVFFIIDDNSNSAFISVKAKLKNPALWRSKNFLMSQKK